MKLSAINKIINSISDPDMSALKLENKSYLSSIINRGRKKPGSGPKDYRHSEESRAKIKAARIGSKRDPAIGKAISAALLAKPKIACEHCGTFAAANTLARFHNNNCKQKSVK